MPSRVIALAFADLHIHKHQAFDRSGSRLSFCITALQMIAQQARQLKVPMLFAGDLYHNPKHVENQVNTITLRVLNELLRKDGNKMIAISGNHDQSQKSYLLERSPSHLEAFTIFPQFKLLDRVGQYQNIFGAPYYSSEGDLIKRVKQLSKKAKNYSGNLPKILLLHTDFPGALSPTGIVVGEVTRLKNHHTKDFDLVLCGHIHKAQKLNSRSYMLGTPLQHDRGQEDEKCGYWKIYSDSRMEFVELPLPKFITIAPGTTPPDDFHYYTEATNDELLVEKDSKVGEFSLIHSRTKLAKRYIAVKNIKSKTKRRLLIETLNQA